MLLKSTINHIARRKLGLSLNEYGVFEQIMRMSNGSGWCNLSRANQAEDVGVSKRTVINIIDRLCGCDIIEKDSYGRTRLTPESKLIMIESEAELIARMNKKIGEKISPVGEKTAPSIGEEIAPPGEKIAPIGGEKISPVGEKTAPNNSIYTSSNKENTVCCKEAAQQIEKNQEESTPETEHEWEEKAVRVIIQKIKSAPRPVKDQWNRHMPKIINYGFTADEVIEDCARKLLNYDQILRNLAGRELHDTAQALPQRRFLDFFGRSWLNNIKPKDGAQIRQLPPRDNTPKVLPSFKHYRHA